MKKFICGFIAGSMLCSGITIFASNGIKEAFFNDEIKVASNGIDTGLKVLTVVTYDNPSGSSYLPLRKTAEILGKDIQWNDVTNTANVVDVSKESTPSPILQTPSPIKTPIGEIQRYIKDGYNIEKIDGVEYISTKEIFTKYPEFSFQWKPDKTYSLIKLRVPSKESEYYTTLLNGINATAYYEKLYVTYEFFVTTIKPLLK